MSCDILHAYSSSDLSTKIQQAVLGDVRSLPHKSKVFAAIAKMQKFDDLPEMGPFEKLNELIKLGGIELNRGISSTTGVQSHIYVKELACGALYPGILSATGNGIHFAVPSQVSDRWAVFPKISVVAQKYTKKGPSSGALIRAVLKPDAKSIDFQDVRNDFKQYKNRAKNAGIVDAGAFAAAIGIDALYADGMNDDSDERIYTVFNRGKILFQNQFILV
jgi:hypothetical protein